MADDDDYDKTRRVSLTQAYRRPTDGRQPIGNRRIGINNGSHPVYKVNQFLFRSFIEMKTKLSTRMMIIIINNNHHNNLVHQAIVFQQRMPPRSIVEIRLWPKSMMPN